MGKGMSCNIFFFPTPETEASGIYIAHSWVSAKSVPVLALQHTASLSHTNSLIYEFLHFLKVHPKSCKSQVNDEVISLQGFISMT